MAHDPLSRDALQEALKAEHVAVYGYGLLGARSRGPLRSTATVIWDDHRGQRDRLTTRLHQRGVRPVAAAAAYRLPVQVVSTRDAALLAALLEEDLITAYTGLTGSAEAALRALAVEVSQKAMTRAVHWRARAGVPSPGPASAFPGLPRSALFPRPEPGD
jgi:Domain of unknown function (DUF4439)